MKITHPIIIETMPESSALLIFQGAPKEFGGIADAFRKAHRKTHLIDLDKQDIWFCASDGSADIRNSHGDLRFVGYGNVI